MENFGRYGFGEAVYQRLGYTGIEVADRLWQLCERRSKGMYERIAGSDKKKVFASISKNDLNAWGLEATRIRRRASLKKWEVHRHLATNRKEEMVWYVNDPLVNRDCKLCLLMVDVDCHHGEPHEEAIRTANLIRLAFDYSYMETSTSGVGIHLYVLVSWHRLTSNWTIVGDIRRMQAQILSLTKNRPVSCSEVKGQPFLDDSPFSVGKYGLWAKLPHPKTPDEAEELLTALDVHTPINDVLARLGQGKDADSPSATPRANAAASSSPAARSKQEEGEKGRYNSIGVTPSPDTFRRAREYVLYYRPRYPSASQDEGFQAYQDAGLAIGNSDQECFSKAWAYSERTFDPSKATGRTSVEGSLARGTALVSDALDTNGLIADLSEDHMRRRREYTNRGCSPGTIRNLKCLTAETLAQLVSCIIYELSTKPSHTATFGKKQAQALMLGVYGYKLADTEFKAAMEWLRRNGLVKLTKYQQPGVCRRYQFCAQEESPTRTMSPSGAVFEDASDSGSRFQMTDWAISVCSSSGMNCTRRMS